MNNKRLFLLPGFGEDTFCFDEIIPYIKGYELIQVDYRQALNKFKFPIITRKQFCKRLIEQYDILPEDKLLGHSMGGYFAFQIREILGNEICMLSAFSDTKKVIHTVPQFPRTTQFGALTGLIKLPFIKKHILSKIKNENYKAVQGLVMENFKRFTNKQLALMTEMLYENGMVSTLPDPLRIHDRADRVIRPPDEKYVQISGGHFCSNLHPAETFEAMKDFLNDKK